MQMQIIIDRFLRIEKHLNTKLTSSEKLLLYFIGSYCSDKDHCWPSQETLMEDCSISKPTLIKATKKLEDEKLIFVKRKHNNNNIYRINIEQVGVYLLPWWGKMALPRGKMALPQEVKNRPTNNISNNINNKTRSLNEKNLKTHANVEGQSTSWKPNGEKRQSDPSKKGKVTREEAMAAIEAFRKTLNLKTQ